MDRARRPPRLLPAIGTRCTGCGRCIGACPPRVLWLEPVGWEKRAMLHDAAGCTGCSQCAVVCPFDAIRMERAPVSPSSG